MLAQPSLGRQDDPANSVEMLVEHTICLGRRARPWKLNTDLLPLL
jgi:hypothetical protein